MAGPPPLPLPALGISMGAPWMGGASGDAYLAVTLATGCAPPPPPAPIGWQEQDTPRAVPGGCRCVAGPPPTPLPALGISMGAPWMGGASGDAYLAVTLATGCAPPPPPSPIGWQEQDTPRAVPGGCRCVAGPPPLPLPALGISMGAPWMGGASGDAYLAVTLATGCAPPPPHAHRLAGAGHPPRSAGRV